MPQSRLLDRGQAPSPASFAREPVVSAETAAAGHEGEQGSKSAPPRWIGFASGVTFRDGTTDDRRPGFERNWRT